jgi:hypothetical protein
MLTKALIATLSIVAAASGSEPAPPPGGTTVPQAKNSSIQADLAVVGQGRILFSHHSVGRNVLEGMGRVAAEAGAAPPKLVPLAEAASVPGPALIDASGGRNGDPVSKIEFFEATLRGQPGLKPDVAFMKLCYVDFEPRTDVEALFARYQRAIETLRREHPGIRFAHVTAPLKSRPTGLKASLQRLMGREVWEDAANARRWEFNQKLLRAFPSDPVFDLAAIEATGPDGKPVTFELDGKRYPSMDPGLTDDGGHLNASGQRAAGAAAIRFLAAALAGRPTN